MRRTALLLALTLPGVPAIAAESPLKTPEQTRTLCAGAAAAFGEGDSDAAFAALASHWPLARAELDALAAQTTAQLAGVGQRFGATLGHEQLRSMEVGTSLLEHTYLVKFERHAIRFSCRFYRPDAHWLVNSVSWDDKINELFE